MQNATMIFGYARVSTDAQDLTSQLAQLKGAGCEKVFRAKITGTTADRPQLQKLMKALAPGDVVVPPAVDRLCRDRLCDPWRCREARTPPHRRTHRTGPRRRQGQGRQIRPQA